MPLPPGYIQAGGEDAAPPPPLPKRNFEKASMPLPPGQVQGPPIVPGDAADGAVAAPRNRAARRRTAAAQLRRLATPHRVSRRPRDQARPVALPRPTAAAPPPRPAPLPRRRLRWRRWSRRLRRRVWLAALIIVPAAMLLVVGALVLREMRHVGIVVMPVSVPTDIAATGRTPAVLAAHLIDQIDHARRLTRADLSDRPEGSLPPSPPVGPPAPLLSRRGIASVLRDLFAVPVQRVTADVVTQSDGKLALRVQMTGIGEVASRRGLTAEQIDTALAAAAPEVWRIAEPTLYAWYKSETEPRPVVVMAELRSLLKDPSLDDAAARRSITMLLARAELAAGDLRGALATLDAIGPAGKTDPAVLAVRANVLLNLGRAADAEEVQRQVLVLAPNSAWAHVSTARFNLSTSKFDTAYQQARAALRLAPGNGAAMMLESAALVALQRIPEAVQVARQAIRLAPGQPGVQEALGNALLASHRPDLALGLYDGELKLRPGRVTALIGRARALQELGHPADALAASEAALKITPHNGTAMLLRAWSLLAVKRPQDALASFDSLLGSRPDMPVLLQGKAASLAALGRNADALVVLQRLNTLVPNNAKLQAEIKRLQNLGK